MFLKKIDKRWSWSTSMSQIWNGLWTRRMCGSPGVIDTKNSKMLNVFVCGQIIVSFPHFIRLELYTCKLVPSTSKLCVLLTIPMLHRRGLVNMIWDGEYLLWQPSPLFHSYLADSWLWALSLSLLPSLGDGCTGLLNMRRWIFVLFCGNPLFCSIASSLTPEFPSVILLCDGSTRL